MVNFSFEFSLFLFIFLIKSIAEKQLERYNLVSYVPLNVNDEDTISILLQHIDHAIQYGEDEEPTEPKGDDFDDDD